MGGTAKDLYETGVRTSFQQAGVSGRITTLMTAAVQQQHTEIL